MNILLRGALISSSLLIFSLFAQTATNRNLKTWTQTVTMTVRNMKVFDSSLFISPWAPQVHRAAHKRYLVNKDG